MAPKNSPLNYTSADLELEVIKRFRSLVPFLPAKCRIFRELDDQATVLCLDFADCPEDLESNMGEFIILLALSAHYLRLAAYLAFKVGNQLKGILPLSEIMGTLSS